MASAWRDTSDQAAVCERKRRFMFESQALSEAHRQSDLRGVNVSVYRCVLCGGFHLTNGKGYSQKKATRTKKHKAKGMQSYNGHSKKRGGKPRLVDDGD